jgi:tetratricopeptide (TPR) repeat protein
VQGYFGWVGSTVVSAISFVDYPRKYAEFFSQGFDSPLAMGFFKSLPSLQSKYKTQFYNQLTAMNEVFNLQQLYASRGEYNKALKLFEKNKNLLSWRKSYVKVNTKISQINRQIRIIQANESLTEAEKIDRTRQLNIVKNDMIQNLTEAVLSWEKSTGQRVKRPIWWK